MRAQTIIAALAVAGLAASAVNAAGTSNPKDLLLRSSDVPAGAKRVSFGGAKGAIKIPRTVHGKSAYVGYRFKNGSRSESVAEAVGTVASSGDAHDVFVKLKRDITRIPSLHRINVPKYGDEQVSLRFSLQVASSGVVLVRLGNMLWEVVVTEIPGASKAQVTAELEKYARKAKDRAQG
jgi:hypothetical protein